MLRFGVVGVSLVGGEVPLQLLPQIGEWGLMVGVGESRAEARPTGADGAL